MRYYRIVLISFLIANPVLAVETVPSVKPVLVPPVQSQEDVENSHLYEGAVNVPPVQGPGPANKSRTDAEETPAGVPSPAPGAGPSTGMWFWITVPLLLLGAGIGFWFLKHSGGQRAK